jgi:hypothetical protein
MVSLAVGPLPGGSSGDCAQLPAQRTSQIFLPRYREVLKPRTARVHFNQVGRLKEPGFSFSRRRVRFPRLRARISGGCPRGAERVRGRLTG